MRVQYVGHSSFLIESEGNRIVMDPFSPEIGIPFPPKIRADIVTVSHGHYDHNNVQAVEGDPIVISQVGEQQVKGMEITGVPTFHDAEHGSARGNNIVYVLESEGVCLVHLGDLGHILSPHQVEAIGLTNVLLIPVGGYYTIGPTEAVEVTRQLNPNIIVPMHYRTDDREGSKVLADVQQFLDLIDCPYEELASFSVVEDLMPPAAQPRVIVLKRTERPG